MGSQDLHLLAQRPFPSPLPNSVLDIGGSVLSPHLHRNAQKKLFNPTNQKPFLSDSFFSDDTGLAIWRDLNQLPDYYQTDHEIELLREYEEEIATLVCDGTAIVDLGCGDIRKVLPLLTSLEAAGKTVSYYALDLSFSALQKNLDSPDLKSFTTIKTFGLWGTFEDGFKYASSLPQPKLYLSLGSIYGNDRFDRAVKYLSRCASFLGPADRLLLGVDCCQDRETVWKSYHDAYGIFENFVRNAFRFSNRVLGEWYRDKDWVVEGRLDEGLVAHRFVLKARREVVFEGGLFKEGEEIECYEGFKQTADVMRKQFLGARLEEVGMWWKEGLNIYEFLLRAPEGNAFKADGRVADGFWG